MKAIVTKLTKTTLNAPKDFDKKHGRPCVGLPCSYNDGVWYSYWKPDFAERVKILFGKRVRLALVSNTHPPVAIDATNN